MSTTASTPLAADVIDVDALNRLRAADPMLRILDVRTGSEFEHAHIPGSYNVPLDTLGEHVADLADVSHPVVLVCQSGGRASQAQQRLVQAGKQNLHLLKGGIAAWREAGGEVVVGESRVWSMERQVRFTAGSLVAVAVVLSAVVPGVKWVAAAVGGGLVFAAATDTCAMASVLGRLPWNRGRGCDIAGVLDDLNRP